MVEVNPEGALVHEYVSPVTEAAPTETEPAEQMAVLAITAAAGTGFTEIVTELEFLQPELFVSVRVYVAVDAGFTIGLDEVELKPETELVHE